jgi:hypothetical protein
MAAKKRNQQGRNWQGQALKQSQFVHVFLNGYIYAGVVMSPLTAENPAPFMNAHIRQLPDMPPFGCDSSSFRLRDR